MHVRSLSLRNFLSFGDEVQKIEFASLNTIVGPNGVGKTNMLRAFDLIHELLRNRRIELEPYYYNGQLGGNLEVRLEVELDETEIQALTDFLICSASLPQGVYGLQNENSQKVETLRNKAVFGGGIKFAPLFSSVSLRISGPWQEANPPDVEFLVRGKEREFSIARSGAIRGEHGSIGQLTLPQAILETLREKNQPVKEYLDMKSQILDPPTFNTDDIFDIVVNIVDRNIPTAIVIEGFQSSAAESALGSRPEFRRLRGFMRERGYRSVEGYLSLFALIQIIFSSSIIRVESPRASSDAYLDPIFLESTAPPIYLLTGTRLPLVLFRLKNSSRPKDMRRFKEVLKQFEALMPGRELDVSIKTVRARGNGRSELVAVPQQPGLTAIPVGGSDTHLVGVRSQEVEEIQYLVTIQENAQNLGVPIQLAAAGTFETILLVTAVFAQDGATVLLDEPALNLHPVIQKHLSEALQLSAAGNHNQLILITHSPYLVDGRQLNTTWRVDREKNGTTLLSVGHYLDQLENRETERTNLRMGNPELRALLFARGVVFVEGPSDKIVIEEIDRQSGSTLEVSEWSVVALGSKDNLPSYARIGKALRLPLLAVVDRDALVSCDRMIKTKTAKVQTSLVFRALYQIGNLSDEELEALERTKTSSGEGHAPVCYGKENFNELRKLARTKGVFVLESDLEGTLQDESHGKRAKPLNAFDRIHAQLVKNEVSPELNDLVSFLKENVGEPGKTAGGPVS